MELAKAMTKLTTNNEKENIWKHLKMLHFCFSVSKSKGLATLLLLLTSSFPSLFYEDWWPQWQWFCFSCVCFFLCLTRKTFVISQFTFVYLHISFCAHAMVNAVFHYCYCFIVWHFARVILRSVSVCLYLGLADIRLDKKTNVNNTIWISKWYTKFVQMMHLSFQVLPK